MEEFKEISKEKKKRVKNTYPIYMDKVLIEKVRNWQQQVNERFSGLVTATVSDVCVALLEDCEEKLSDKVFDRIESSKLDPVKKLKLLLNKAVESSKSGESLDLQALLDQNSELLGLELKKKRPVKRRKKTDQKNEEKPVKNSISEGFDE